MVDSTLIFCGVVLIIAVIGIVIVRGRMAASPKETVANAYVVYEEALALLKANPANEEYKERAIMLGRVYSRLTREQNGVNVFDEVALMNEITAATAHAQSEAPMATVEDRLRQLDRLRDKGFINDSEYEERRTRILTDV